MKVSKAGETLHVAVRWVCVKPLQAHACSLTWYQPSCSLTANRANRHHARSADSGCTGWTQSSLMFLPISFSLCHTSDLDTAATRLKDVILLPSHNENKSVPSTLYGSPPHQCSKTRLQHTDSVTATVWLDKIGWFMPGLWCAYKTQCIAS